MGELTYSESRQIEEIAKKFAIVDGKIEWIIPINTGRINSTYKIVVSHGVGDTTSYLLQKVNTHVFKKPYEVMENAIRVTEHIRQQGKQTIRFIKTKNSNANAENDAYIYLEIDDEGLESHWRMSEFIHSEVFQSITKPEDMYTLARMVCGFSLSLKWFDAKSLHVTIPNFHNTRERFEVLMISATRNLMDDNVSHRAKNPRAREAIEFVIELRPLLTKIVEALESKIIPYRVTHNDPKLNNVLFDRKTNKPICLIDLDTVMPGSILYDIGDAIRSGANTISEEDKDYKKASLDLVLYEQFVRGCADSNILTPGEAFLIPNAVMIITCELGIRFLTDYLDGSIYFSAEYEEQNLDRAWIQFSLVKDILDKMPQLCEIRDKYFQKK